MVDWRGRFGAGLVYDVQLKRTPLSFPLGGCIPVDTGVGPAPPMPGMRSSGGRFPLAVCLPSPCTSPTRRQGHRERALGVLGPAQALGERRSLAIAAGLYGLASSGALAVLLVVAQGQAALIAVTGAVSLLLLPRARTFFGRDGVFGVLAAGSAALAVLFLSAA